MKNSSIFLIVKIGLIILFVLCLLKMPYSYYEITRFVGMVGFVIIGYDAYKKENTTFTIIWFASALLINPFFKLALGRTLWNIIDIIWIILIINSLKRINKL